MKNIFIGPYVVIGDDVSIGDRCQISAGTKIGEGVIIGEDCKISPNVVLYSDVVIGSRVILHAGVVIGSDGFGYVQEESGDHLKFPQTGVVVLEDDVEVGANSTIDRGTIEETRICSGTKIDNQVQIGHNCIIGDHTIICGQAGIVGSTIIGRNCILAGGVGIGGGSPIRLCDGVMVSAKATVTQSIDIPGIYSGVAPYMEHKKWLRNSTRYKDLDALFKRVKNLEEDHAG